MYLDEFHAAARRNGVKNLLITTKHFNLILWVWRRWYSRKDAILCHSQERRTKQATSSSKDETTEWPISYY